MSCEFHYLRRDATAAMHADPLAMSWALADAAADAGIGLTILPVLYEARLASTPTRSRDDQRRFRSTHAQTFRRCAAHLPRGRPLAECRPCDPFAACGERRLDRRACARSPRTPTWPDPHIHVAEQTGEVDECLRTTGDSGRSNGSAREEACSIARWQLVHATHASADEIAAVAGERRRGVVVSPEHRRPTSATALRDLSGWLDAGVP